MLYEPFQGYSTFSIYQSTPCLIFNSPYKTPISSQNEKYTTFFFQDHFLVLVSTYRTSSPQITYKYFPIICALLARDSWSYCFEQQCQTTQNIYTIVQLSLYNQTMSRMN